LQQASEKADTGYYRGAAGINTGQKTFYPYDTIISQNKERLGQHATKVDKIRA